MSLVDMGEANDLRAPSLVQPCAAQEHLVDSLPLGAMHKGALYPGGARIMDVKEVHDLLYKVQRPANAPMPPEYAYSLRPPPL